MLEADLQGLLDNGVDGLDAFDAAEPPAFLAAAVQAITQAPEAREWLRKLGRYIALRGIGEFKEMVFGRPTPPSPWMSALVDPWLNEIEEGVMEVLRSKVRPWAWGLAAITGLAGIGLGALIAGRKRRLVERVRRETIENR